LNARANFDSIKYSEDGLGLFRFSNLSSHNNDILHFVTTKKGGFSLAPYDSFNLAFHVGDNKEDILKNRVKLAQSLQISPKNFTALQQVHGTRVSIINSHDRGRGAFDIESAINNSDAMLTDQKEICLLILVADCVPLLLYDRKKKIIAAIHAGWKGTVGLIAWKTVHKMLSVWDCKPQDLICAIGPSIGPCCYQVGPEVIALVKEKFQAHKQLIGSISKSGRGYLNLWEANRQQLLECHIPEGNIEIAGICTNCHSDIFFSSRKSNGLTGRFAAGIMLKRKEIG